MKKIILFFIAILFLLACRDTSSMHIERGKFFYSKGLYEESAMEFHAAVNLDADNAVALHNLAVSYAQLGWFTYALDAAEKSFDLCASSNGYRLIQSIRKQQSVKDLSLQ